MHTNTLRLGIVTGLRAEARIAAPLGMVAAGGGLPEGAAAAAERLVALGAPALLSFGLCGGLEPGLGAGFLAVPRTVSLPPRARNTLPERDSGATQYTADRTLLARIGPATCDSLLAGDVIARSRADKAALFAATGAAAIDLESGAVAQVAARHGLPFAVLRAVCDPADFDLPPTALLALDAGGAIQPWAVAASLLRQPGQIPALIALARAAAAARAALIRRVAEIGGSGVGRGVL